MNNRPQFLAALHQLVQMRTLEILSSIFFVASIAIGVSGFMAWKRDMASTAKTEAARLSAQAERAQTAWKSLLHTLEDSASLSNSSKREWRRVQSVLQDASGPAPEALQLMIDSHQFIEGGIHWARHFILVVGSSNTAVGRGLVAPLSSWIAEVDGPQPLSWSRLVNSKSLWDSTWSEVLARSNSSNPADLSSISYREFNNQWLASIRYWNALYDGLLAGRSRVIASHAWTPSGGADSASAHAIIHELPTWVEKLALQVAPQFGLGLFLIAAGLAATMRVLSFMRKRRALRELILAFPESSEFKNRSALAEAADQYKSQKPDFLNDRTETEFHRLFQSSETARVREPLPPRALDRESQTQASLGSLLADSELELVGIVAECEMSIAQLHNLRVGQTIPIPVTDLVHVKLQNVPLASGVMGMRHGVGALEITDMAECDPKFTESLGTISPEFQGAGSNRRNFELPGASELAQALDSLSGQTSATGSKEQLS